MDNELQAFLAKSPAEIADADKHSHSTFIAHNDTAYRDSLVREAAQRTLEEMLAEKHR